MSHPTVELLVELIGVLALSALAFLLIVTVLL